MTMPFYASVDQLMRDRSELARKGISRGRSVVVLTCADGVLFVAENRSKSLRKVSEIYDQLGFAAVGRYNEFENLRRAGIRYADVQGYSYDRRDVSGRALANAYAQILGASFIEQQKPFEVELCVGVGGRDRRPRPALPHHLRRLDLRRAPVRGDGRDDRAGVGRAPLVLRGGAGHPRRAADRPRRAAGPERVVLVLLPSSSEERSLGVDALEVALLDRGRRGRRAFRRISGAALAALLPERASSGSDEPEAPAGDTGAGDEVSGAGGADA